MMTDIHPLLLQFGGSLAAILVLAALAVALKLGGKPVLGDERDAARIAGEVEDGFEPVRVSISREGSAALLRDASGRIMLVRRHGNKFAGRILTPATRVREEVDGLLVDPGESRFGTARLSLGDAGYWADAINRL